MSECRWSRWWRGWGLAALLLALSGCDGWDAGRGGQLRIDTQPPGAALTVNGQPQDVAPVTLTNLPAGAYLVIARKDGYAEARTSVALLAGQKQAVELPLEPVKGLLLLRSTPPGAQVEIAGAARGRTPLLLTDLGLGEHRVKFTAEGCHPKELLVRIADRRPQQVLAELLSDAARVRFVSDPTGAVVRLNGAARGVTPCTLERVPSGVYEVELALEGYAPHRQKLALQAAENAEVRGRLTAVPATLELVSLPEKARVYLNDQFRGESPVTIAALPPGVARVRVELEGYETDARTLTLRPAEKKTEEFRLVPNSGALLLVSEPAGAQVFVDGKAVGTTVAGASPMISQPLRVDLLGRGAHKLQLVRPGYAYPGRSFSVEPGQVVSLQERLTRRFIPDTLVRLGPRPEDVRTGLLLRKHPNGDLELESNPGIILRVEAAKIFSVEPIRPESLP